MAPPTPKSFRPSSATAHKKARKNAKAAKNSQSPEGVSKNAARERSRVRSLRAAFVHLQSRLPSVPPDTKLSKLDVLILATSYISHLSRLILEDEILQGDGDFSLVDILQMDVPSFPVPEVEARNPNWEKSYLHPVKKWPMRSRLYAGVEEADSTSSCQGQPVLQPGQW